MSETANCYQMLSDLCPMHIVVGRKGRIVHAGPTANKISPKELIGQHFLDVFDVKRPQGIVDTDSLWRNAGTQLTLQFRESACRSLKGFLAKGPSRGQMVVNLSFGISVVNAVQDYHLTAVDFAPTDLTVELLYLVEAKSAAMKASRQLNERLQAARDAAEEQALTDILTGLKNRRAMDLKLESLVEAGEPFALMQIDLDFFKAVNDTHGHGAGDLVLRNVGEAMKAQTRQGDLVARVGGDEFVVLMPESGDRAALSATARRIIEGIQKPLEFDGQYCAVSGSIGIALSADYDAPSADKMLRDADAALYAAKRDGRGKHAFFSSGAKPEKRTKQA